MGDAVFGTAVERLRGRLVVSCQAAEGEPLCHTETLCRMAAAAIAGGAGGLRAEGAERVAAFRGVTALPIVGMAKSLDAAGAVYITATFVEAAAVNAAGADVIAMDCTRRRLVEREAPPELVRRVHAELGRPVCADIATVEDALMAEDCGADAVATTLFGYTAETAGRREVPWELLEALVGRLSIPVILEGHVTGVEEVRRAMGMGVHAVVVGSAITRPQVITARLVAGLGEEKRR